MRWLQNFAAARRAELVATCRAHAALRRSPTRELFAAMAPHQYYFSRHFTGSLLIRAGECDDTFSDDFRRHAASEIRHPRDYLRWCTAVSIPIAGAPSRETVDLSVRLREIARDGSRYEQVLAMNLAAEGVALDFFDACRDPVVAVFGQTSSFWQDHCDDDAEHSLIGLDRIAELSEGNPAAGRYRDVVRTFVDGFRAMLDTWVPSLSCADSWPSPPA